MDLAWRIRSKRIDEQSIKDAATAVASAYQDVTMEAEREDNDCLTLFFAVPSEHQLHCDVEISFYELGKDGVVLSLEADASDNHDAWEDASQIAEDLADALDGVLLDV